MVNKNENRMVERGQTKVWKTILTKQGNTKTISSTQLGQQIIFDDALRIISLVRDWIDNGSAKSYRKELISYFVNDKILLEKITETMLYLVGAIYTERDESNKNRHRKINSIQKHVLQDLSFEQVWRFTETVVDFSTHFDVAKDKIVVKNALNNQFYYTCSLGEEIIERVALEASHSFFPEPMLTPPIPWSFVDGELVGGYETYQYPLIRAGRREVDYSIYPQNIFDAVNYIQNVPWRVNKRMVEVIKSDLKLPVKTDFVHVEYPSTDGTRFDIDLKGKHGLSKKKSRK